MSARKRVRKRAHHGVGHAYLPDRRGLCGWCGGTRDMHDPGVCARPGVAPAPEPRPPGERGSRTARLARALSDVNDALDALERLRAAKVLRGRAELVLLRVLDDLGRVVDDLEEP